MAAPAFLREATQGDGIGVLSCRNAASLAISDASARIPLPDGAQVVTIWANVDVHFRMGDASVTAGTGTGEADGIWPAALPIDLPVRYGETHIAAVAASGTGTLHVMARE